MILAQTNIIIPVLAMANRQKNTVFSRRRLYGRRKSNCPDMLILSGILICRMDASALQYDDESFDVIIIANALHIIPDPEKVLSEIRRVLKKDGLLITPNFIHENNKKISGIFSKALSFAGVVFEAKWDADGYKAFLEENGFRVKHSKQLASTIPLIYTECIAEK